MNARFVTSTIARQIAYKTIQASTTERETMSFLLVHISWIIMVPPPLKESVTSLILYIILFRFNIHITKSATHRCTSMNLPLMASHDNVSFSESFKENFSDDV